MIVPEQGESALTRLTKNCFNAELQQLTRATASGF